MKKIGFFIICIGCIGLLCEHFFKFQLFKNATYQQQIILFELILLIGLVQIAFSRETSYSNAIKNIQLTSFKRALGLFLIYTIAVGISLLAGSTLRTAPTEYLYIPIACCVIYITNFYASVKLKIEDERDKRISDNDKSTLQLIGFYCLSIFFLFLLGMIIV